MPPTNPLDDGLSEEEKWLRFEELCSEYFRNLEAREAAQPQAELGSKCLPPEAGLPRIEDMTDAEIAVERCLDVYEVEMGDGKPTVTRHRCGALAGRALS